MSDQQTNEPAELPQKPGYISTTGAAQLLLTSRQYINELARKGFLPKADRGSFRIVDIVQAYIRYLQDENRASKKTAAQSRWQDQRTEDLALKIEQRRGLHLIEGQEEAISIIDEFGGSLRSDLLSIPARVTNDLALRRKIGDLIDEAFGDAAKKAASAADRVAETGRALAKAAETDSGGMGSG